MTPILKNILKLSVPERILMVEAIWDSITENEEKVELTKETRQILDERLEAHSKNSEEGSNWEIVKTRIKKATLMYKLIIKPLAEADAIDAAKWYNDALEGLGNELLLALDAKINAIKRNPKQFTLVHKNIRRALTERFPYGIYFIIENQIIYILAIVHSHRNPKLWKKRSK